jgi:hypothetical protein
VEIAPVIPEIAPVIPEIAPVIPEIASRLSGIHALKLIFLWIPDIFP